MDDKNNWTKMAIICFQSWWKFVKENLSLYAIFILLIQKSSPSIAILKKNQSMQ